ncbi:MAG: twin-arginine translocase subunit TatC [candidate division Zixibacteria bacterium]|nr:twin-arginine translocase subunit TatC [candidate division Zixibacteria bacterium]MDD5426960.1 twin-arginine translocase subunit TatC [candidate division Zixibacteria bacterium]
MSFVDHLEELRWRLFKAILSVVIMAIVAFYFSDWIFRFLLVPLGDTKLYVTEVTGSFYAYLKIALFAGIFGAFPIVFYQLWMFVAPGLYKHEKKVVIPLVLISSALFLVGAGFCYVVVLPLALKFLIGFSGDLLNPIITVGSYISFAGLLMVTFGLAFELPIIAFFLGKMGLISSQFLARGRRYAIVIILVIAAIITPPDVFTQVVLAIPIYFLYEVSIILVKFTGKKK